MSTRLLFAAFVMSLAVAGCARPTPEQQFINDAADALGGRNRIQAVKTLTIEGDGTNYNLGQDMKPDAATQQFAVTGYKRQIDLANRRQRVEQTRTPRRALQSQRFGNVSAFSSAIFRKSKNVICSM